MLKFFQKSICLEPKYFDKRLKDALLLHSKATFIGKCSKEDGYVLDIVSIVEIVDNHISSSNSSSIFTLKLVAKLLRPEVGNHLNATVNMVRQEGIFCRCEDKLNIFIPVKQLQDTHVFDRVQGVYTTLTGTGTEPERFSKIGIKSVITVEITAVRYSKNNYTCIANLVS